ncbi:MAG: hypothetical protein QM698_12060 [Micropepsaceae bacterium]
MRYVVTESLEGRAGSLKGYSIAVDVFERPADFDQAADPIVRVEASRLRRALAQYYQGSGNSDPVVIELPRGGYVPSFRRRAEAASAEPDAVAAEPPPDRPPDPPLKVTQLPGVLSFRYVMIGAVLMIGLAIGYLVYVAANLEPGVPPSVGRSSGAVPSPALNAAPSPVAGRFQPVIAVTALANLSSDSADDLVARGLTEELVVNLARFQEFVVYQAAGDQTLPDTGYVLSGTVRRAGTDIRVTVQLAEMPGSRMVWTQTYERIYEVGNLLAIQDEIASSVATAIGQSDGIIYERELANAAARPATMEGYTCVLGVYAYWRAFDPAEHARLRDCLEKTVADDPGYADAWQMLTFMYLDEYRYGYNTRPMTAYRPLDKALETAQRAVFLAATDARSYEALYAAYFYRGDVEAFRRTGADARRLNPNNPDIMADFGNKLVNIGAYDEGAALIRKALGLNPGHPGWYNIGMVIEAYRRGAYDEALAAAERMNMPLHYRSWMFFAMIYGEMGDGARALAAREELLKLEPDFELNARSDMKKWGFRADLVEMCVAGLKKAGLEISGP